MPSSISLPSERAPPFSNSLHAVQFVLLLLVLLRNQIVLIFRNILMSVKTKLISNFALHEEEFEYIY